MDMCMCVYIFMYLCIYMCVYVYVFVNVYIFHCSQWPEYLKGHIDYLWMDVATVHCCRKAAAFKKIRLYTNWQLN